MFLSELQSKVARLEAENARLRAGVRRIIDWEARLTLKLDVSEVMAIHLEKLLEGGG